jgi:hypothetical protein
MIPVSSKSRKREKAAATKLALTILALVLLSLPWLPQHVRLPAYCLFCSLLVRAVLSFACAMRLPGQLGYGWKQLWRDTRNQFFGLSLLPEYEAKGAALPFLLGAIETGAYAWVIAHWGLGAEDAWKAIGAWLALKTAGQWGAWQKSRLVYNRFLLGNALTIVAALLAVHWGVVDP